MARFIAQLLLLASCVAAGQAVTAFLGERVTLTSYWRRVSLGPEIEVSWFKLGPGEEQVLIGRMHHDVIFIEWPFRGFFDIHRSANTFFLVVTAANISHDGNYLCRMKLGETEVTKQERLSVVKPLTLSVHSERSQFPDFSVLTVTCTVNAFPHPHVQWLMPEGVEPAPTAANGGVMKEKNGSLSVAVDLSLPKPWHLPVTCVGKNDKEEAHGVYVSGYLSQ